MKQPPPLRKPKRAAGPNSVERWRQQLRFSMTWAEKVLVQDGAVLPFFHIITPDGQRDIVVSAEFRDSESKQMSVTLVQLLCVVHDAVAVSFTAEAWMKSIRKTPNETKAEFDERAFEVPPSQSESRIEVVVSTVSWRDEAGERLSLSDNREIERRSNGKPSGLKAIPGINEPTKITGRMADILPTRLASPEDKRRATAALEMIRSLGAGPTEH